MDSSAPSLSEPFLSAEGLDRLEDAARSDTNTSVSSKPQPSETLERKEAPVRFVRPSLWEKLYTPPVQRLGGVSHKSLEEHDESAEWNHIFLDLFYVPAISNLSEMLQAIYSSGQVNTDEDGDARIYSTHGYLCFFAVFFSIWSTWYHNAIYVCKFVANSKFHRMMNRTRLLLVAIAIFHIKEAEEMIEIANETSFYFCLGITLECALTILGRIELILQGNAPMKRDSVVHLCSVFIPRLALYTAAWVSQSHSREWPVLVLCGSLIPSVLAATGEYFFAMVPIDQDKYNERIGAWVSVLLGEGVIGLLKMNSHHSDEDRWITVIIGIVTLMVLHSIYFQKHGSVRHSDKFRGWLQSGSIQALSIGAIGIGVFAANGPNFELLQSLHKLHLRDYDVDVTTNITEVCHIFMATDGQSVPIDSSKTTVFPISIKQKLNKAYFVSLAIILLSLELVFWTANPTCIEKMKTWFDDAGIRKRALMGSMFFLQAFVIVSFPVLVHTTAMDELKSEESASVGFASTMLFFISRVYIIEAIDGKDEE